MFVLVSISVGKHAINFLFDTQVRLAKKAYMNV